MVGLNLSLHGARNCKKQRSLKKGILNLPRKQGLSFEKSKQLDKFAARKTCKSVRKVSKT